MTLFRLPLTVQSVFKHQINTTATLKSLAPTSPLHDI